MSRRRLTVVTAAMMLSLFLASIESTVVSTAMPTIVTQLGGLSIYAWVFSAYMLASTTTVPIFGKLSDIYGRRPIYLVAMAIFLIGSLLCGQAQTMPQLIIFRVVQGIGAGGLQPLAFTIIGDIFTFEQRARIQGVFSSVWGISSIIGPLIGGFLVDQVSWQWVFNLNIVPGLLAAMLMVAAWKNVSPRLPGRIDYVGAGLLSGGVVSLLLALFELNTGQGFGGTAFWMLLVLSFVLLAGLLWVEPRAANPILPLELFRDRLFTTAVMHGFAAGFAMFGITSFMPFYVQSVLGTSATAAGAILTPQLLSWVLASITGTRLLLFFSYRSLARVGMTSLVIGTFLMTRIGVDTPYWMLVVNMCLMGVGMGLSVPIFLIAVQTTVPRKLMGSATSTVQFSRSIGGTMGVSIMGVILATRLAGALTTEGVNPDSLSLNGLMDSTVPMKSLEPLRDALVIGVQAAFVVAFIAAVAAWIVTYLAPNGHLAPKSAAMVETQAEEVRGT